MCGGSQFTELSRGQIMGASWTTVEILAFTLSREVTGEFQREDHHDLIKYALTGLFWLLF